MLSWLTIKTEKYYIMKMGGHPNWYVVSPRCVFNIKGFVTVGCTLETHEFLGLNTHRSHGKDFMPDLVHARNTVTEVWIKSAQNKKNKKSWLSFDLLSYCVLFIITVKFTKTGMKERGTGLMCNMPVMLPCRYAPCSICHKRGCAVTRSVASHAQGP